MERDISGPGIDADPDLTELERLELDAATIERELDDGDGPANEASDQVADQASVQAPEPPAS